MSGVLTVFRKEMRIYAVSPLSYVFVGAFLFLAGLFFYLGVAFTGEASLRVMLGNLAISLLFLLPMLTMRLLAEESRQGTWELLVTSPTPLASIVVGKWLACIALCTLMLAGTLVLPLVLEYYGDPDWGVVLTSYIGLLLCCAAFSAAGLFASSLTDDQVAAGLSGVLLLMPFWLIGNASNLLGEAVQPWVDRLALLPHLSSFTRGVVDTADLAWFAGFCFVFLFLTFRTLESRRWR